MNATPGTARAIRWTGHPFVDAGLAAMAAAVDERGPEQLTPEAIEKAAHRLERVLLSDQALGIGTERSFARGALAFLYPNGELVNNSNWKGATLEEKADNVRRKFRSAVAADLRAVGRCLDPQAAGEVVCSACGERRPQSAMASVRKDQMPLMQGSVNFYPGLGVGMRICALCRLALRFVPFCVLNARTPRERRLWFLHSHLPGLMVRFSRLYGWQPFEQAVARGESLDFPALRDTGGSTAAILYVLFQLLDRFPQELRQAFHRPYSTTAYLFINDNRESRVEPVPIPHRLLTLLARLQIVSPSAYGRLWRDLLLVPEGAPEEERRARERFARDVSQRMLAGDAIAGLCLDHEEPALLGGWQGHRLYLEEMRGMPTHRLSLLERLGTAIAASPDAKKWTQALRGAHPGEVYGVLVQLVRAGVMGHRELYALVPPGEPGGAGEVRDLLLAVIYEATRCQQQGEPFAGLGGEPLPPPDETLARLEQVGERLAQGLDSFAAWVAPLQVARRPDQIRRVYLQAVERGLLRFRDFVFLCPWEDVGRMWQLRDYLLAFLFEKAQEAGVEIQVEEPAAS